MRYSLIDGLLTFDDKETKIPDCFFKNRKDIKTLVIHKNIEEIGAEAFSMCSNIEIIIVDDDNAKYYCPTGSNTIVLKDSNVLILGCKNSTIDKCVVNIGPFAFCGQTDLKEIVIPGSCKIISSYAFNGCKSLLSVSMENGVEEIHDFAFKQCDSLENIAFPKTLKRVDDGSFGRTFGDSCSFGTPCDEGCLKIKYVTFDGTYFEFMNVTRFFRVICTDTIAQDHNITVKCLDREVVISDLEFDM